MRVPSSLAAAVTPHTQRDKIATHTTEYPVPPPCATATGTRHQLLRKSVVRSPCSWPALGASPVLLAAVEFHSPPQSAKMPERGPLFVAPSPASAAARAASDGTKISTGWRCCRGIESCSSDS